MQGGGLTMKNDECLKMLGAEDKRYAQEAEELRKRHNANKQKILNQWAKANARFKTGDILQSNDSIIKVTGCYGVYSLYYVDKLYITYRGQALTKALKPRKDGSTFDFYDDGRKITKIG